MRITPLDFAQAEDFMSALTDEDRTFLDDLTAGYSMKEISQRNHIQYSRLPSLRTSLQEKAVDSQVVYTSTRFRPENFVRQKNDLDEVRVKFTHLRFYDYDLIFW